ncbi:hypothetical protein VNO77_12028 [Canavalia gladiata]|uniref:Uncharacterized protein n=1 Tax=Canavalia gladiata TaxID=3824 RepID=A0AAN9M141_CANGL
MGPILPDLSILCYLPTKPMAWLLQRVCVAGPEQIDSQVFGVLLLSHKQDMLLHCFIGFCFYAEAKFNIPDPKSFWQQCSIQLSQIISDSLEAFSADYADHPQITHTRVSGLLNSDLLLIFTRYPELTVETNTTQELDTIRHHLLSMNLYTATALHGDLFINFRGRGHG